MILQGLLKSLLTWFLDLLLSCYNYLSDALIQVFGMDLEYFMDNVPVTAGIMNIMLAVGWALLLGNLVFQAVRGMLSGIGVEADDPKILFGRSFLYGFLLLASRQICEIGMSITGKVIGFLQIPDIVQFPMPEESDFLFGGAWVLVILVDCVMIYQVLRLFLIIGERYVILVFLIILSPVAFGMGGSKQTEDITKGFIRLFGSACLMMVLNLVALKLMLSAMGGFQGGPLIVVWLILIIGIGRLARRLDEMVSRIGLNTTQTGVGMGKGGVPGMLAMAAVRVATKQAGGALEKFRGTGQNGGAKNSIDGKRGRGSQGGLGGTGNKPKGPNPYVGSSANGTGGQPKSSGEKVDFVYADGSPAGQGVRAEPSMSEAGQRPNRPPVGKRRQNEAFHTPPAQAGQSQESNPSRPPIRPGAPGVRDTGKQPPVNGQADSGSGTAPRKKPGTPLGAALSDQKQAQGSTNRPPVRPFSVAGVKAGGFAAQSPSHGGENPSDGAGKKTASPQSAVPSSQAEERQQERPSRPTIRPKQNDVQGSSPSAQTNGQNQEKPARPPVRPAASAGKAAEQAGSVRGVRTGTVPQDSPKMAAGNPAQQTRPPNANSPVKPVPPPPQAQERQGTGVHTSRTAGGVTSGEPHSPQRPFVQRETANQTAVHSQNRQTNDYTTTDSSMHRSNEPPRSTVKSQGSADTLPSRPAEKHWNTKSVLMGQGNGQGYSQGANPARPPSSTASPTVETREPLNQQANRNGTATSGKTPTPRRDNRPSQERTPPNPPRKGDGRK